MESTEHGIPQLTPGEANVFAQLSPVKIFFAVVLVVAAWVLLKWVRGFFERVERHNPRLRFLMRQIEPPLRVAIWFAAVLLSIEILAPSQSAFLAALGSAALAIGLGLQDLIKNLIGGFVVIVDRPFQIGDRVRFGKDEFGEVTQIGLRSTKILTETRMLVTIPNADVLTKSITNANVGVAECMVSTELTLPADCEVDEALSLCHKVAVCCPYTYLGRHVEVALDKDKRTRRTVLVINAYVYDHRYALAMRTEILRRTQLEFLQHGIVTPRDH